MGQTLIKTLLGQLALGGLFEKRDEDMDGTPTGPNRLWKAMATKAYKVNPVGFDGSLIWRQVVNSPPD